MSDKIKISQLQLETNLKEDSLIPIVQDNKTKAIKSKDLLKDLDKRIDSINSQLDNCAKKDDVTRISSGTPLFASSVSDMTDVTRNYVNTTDGYLYRYNGNTFEKTTVLYQATGIDDLNQAKINKSLQGRLSVNMFNKDTQVDGFLSSIGTIAVNENYYTSDFIEVNEGNYSGTYHTGQWFICKYDAYKSLIGSRVLNSNSNISFTVESGVKYVRIAFLKTTVNLQIQEGTQLTEYEPYGQTYFIENSISEDKLTDEVREKLNVDLGAFLTGRKSVNLVDRTKETIGYLGGSGTIITSNPSYSTSDFIEVTEGKSYIGTYAKNYFLCTFDKDKSMVGTRVYTTGNIVINVALGSGIKYVRFSYENTIKNLQFQEGTKLTAYEEYGKSFIVEDSISQDLKNVISQKSSNVIKVSKENGDYDSLTLAVENSNDGDVIMVYPGVYDNEKVVNRDKDISIIGLDKTKCIIQNSFNVYGQDPVTMTQGYIANLTIKALASDEYIYQDGVSECYCLHIDTSGDNSNLLVENCNFYSWHWACVGIGLHQNQKIKIKGCEMYNMQDDVPNRRYAALFHQRNADNVDGQELIFENCLMKSKSGKTFNYQKVGNNSNMKLTMYKNILFDEVNGIDCLNGFTRSGENLDVSGSLKLSNDSFGNNVATLNA